MANTLNLGNGNWATKEGSLLAYNSENNNFKPLPFDFTRASSATVVNKAGLIETVGSGTPRIDFLGNTNGALLLEPQSTNLITYSEDFSQWDIVRATSTANASVSPDGASNAYKLQSSVTSNNGSWYREILSSFSGNYEFSVFAKAGTTNFLQLRVDGIGGVIFDLSDGTIKSQANAVGSVSDYGNGWYRCSIQLTASSSTTLLIIVGNENMTSSVWKSTIGDSIYLYGAQLEQASYATSYIPTSGSTVTRLADSCSQTVPSGVIGQTEGTMFFEGVVYGENSSVNRRIFTISNGTSTTAINIQTPATNSKIEFEVTDGGVTQAFISADNNSLVYGQKFKAAFAYKSNDFVAYINGVQIGTDTSGTVPACDKLSFDRGNDTSNFEGSANQTKLYNTRLSNSELQALTTI